MAMSDPLGDLLTRIRNGQRASQTSIVCPHSTLETSVLNLLQVEGFVRGYSKREVRKGIAEIVVELKYHEGAPVIRDISRISTPGRRVYSAIGDLTRERGGLGVKILSTGKGVLSDSAARAANVGGEVLCRVF